MKRKNWKKVLPIGLAVLLLTGCGSSYDSSYKYSPTTGATESYYEDNGAYDSYYEEAEYEGDTSGFEDVKVNEKSDSNQSQNKAIDERKLIKNVNMDVETKEFDRFMASLEQQIESVNGYIENMNTYNGSSYSTYRDSRNSRLVIRIPQDRLSEFLDTVSGLSNVIRRNDSVDDVTLTYVDMASKRDALKVEQNRLMELLEKAETLEEILIIEDRMTNVRYQLESMESQLRAMDNKVNYSTVTLNVQEVKELTPIVEEEETTWQRISNGFIESLKDVGNGFVEFFVWFVVSLPHLVIWAIVITIIVIIVRKINKRRKNKNEKKQETKKQTRWGKQDAKAEDANAEAAKADQTAAEPVTAETTEKKN